MFCGKCGAQVEDGVRFCPKCGAETGGQSEAAPVKEQSPAKKKGGKGKVTAVVVIAAVLLIGGAGGFACFYMSPQQQYNRAMEKGDACMDEKEYQAAMAFYETALELEDSKEVKKAMAKAYMKCAEGYAQENAYTEAIENYLAAQEYDKKNEDIGDGLVAAYLGAGADSFAKAEYQAAKQYYEEALLIAADSQEAQRGKNDCLVSMGKAALTSADWATARSCFEEVLADEAAHPTACSGMARLMAMEGNVSEALAWLDAVMNEVGGNSELLEEKEYLLENTVVVSKKTIYTEGNYELEEHNEDGTCTYKSYDAQGELIYEKHSDEEGHQLYEKYYYGGGLSCEYVWTYDENGNLLTYVYHDYRYPSASERSEYTYTPEGKEATITTYYAENEYPGYYYEATYEDGLLRLEVKNSINDHGEEFTTQSRTEYQYNEQGDLTEVFWGEYDLQTGEGHAGTIMTYQRDYDSSERLIYSLGDYRYTGDVDYPDVYQEWQEVTEETYAYDADGNVVNQTSLTIHLHGLPYDLYGQEAERRFNQNGWYSKYSEALLDMLDEYALWYNESYVYVETETSYYADGTKAYEKRAYEAGSYSDYYKSEHEYEYNEEGKLLRYATEWNGAKSVTTYAYDEHGNEISRINEDSDGNCLETTADYEYDVFGNMVSCKKRDANNNSSYVTKYEYTYKIK